MQLVAAVIPEPSVVTRRAALAAAAALALSRGVTSVVDMGRYPFSDEGSTWRDLQVRASEGRIHPVCRAFSSTTDRHQRTDRRQCVLGPLPGPANPAMIPC